MTNMRMTISGMKSRMNNLKLGFLFFLFLNSFCGFSQTPLNEIDKKVDRIHQRILTVDSHTDTPMNLMGQGFDISRNHQSAGDD